MVIRFTLLSACGAIAALVGSNATAQEPVANAPDHLKELSACQPIADPTERLACYDKAVASVVTATSAGELKFVDQAEVRKARRRLFGFALPDIGLFGGDGKDEVVDLMESKITNVSYIASDNFMFQIEEGGATWQVTNAPPRMLPVKPGDKVVFKKGAFGSYFVRINDQIGVKGRRIR